MIVYCGLRHFYIHHFEPPQQDAYYILTQNGEIWDFSPALKKIRGGNEQTQSPDCFFGSIGLFSPNALNLPNTNSSPVSGMIFAAFILKIWNPNTPPMPGTFALGKKTILEQFLFDFDQEAQRKGSGGAILGAGASKLVAKLAAHNAPPRGKM